MSNKRSSARPSPWKGAFHYLWRLAEEKQSATDYAMTVRIVYDVLAEDTGDAAIAREFVLFQVSTQFHRRAISNQHRELVTKLLPLPEQPARGRGRPKGALGNATYEKKYQLYRDWIYEKTFNPSLTKEQFGKDRLGITDKKLNGDHADRYRKQLDALLKELKPVRMKYLDEGHRRALEMLYPLVLKHSDASEGR
jgi:hypothetical protein